MTPSPADIGSTVKIAGANSAPFMGARGTLYLTQEEDVWVGFVAWENAPTLSRTWPLSQLIIIEYAVNEQDIHDTRFEHQIAHLPEEK